MTVLLLDETSSTQIVIQVKFSVMIAITSSLTESRYNEAVAQI